MKISNGYVAYSAQLKDLSKNLRCNQTLAEKTMWRAIRKKSIEGCLFLRQKPLLSYIADFYCAKLLLVIEVDGSSHDETLEMDTNRTEAMKAYEITVIRYTNDQILHSLPKVIDHLSRVIRKMKTP